MPDVGSAASFASAGALCLASRRQRGRLPGVMGRSPPGDVARVSFGKSHSKAKGGTQKEGTP